ncbi:MAG: class I SAM-dependent methyltransferase [Spirochaetales bacterium]|nr:class I SAM-dependent methyltransferase [Spirochaetales bacterium]
MAIIKPFEENTEQYENWFERNEYVYRSELFAIKKVIPKAAEGIEIGVGTGRFAAQLGITYGIDPSNKMREIAEEKGIKVCNGIAEDLPYMDMQFDFVLMVTTICFLDDIDAAFKEVYRILKPDGSFIIGFIDKNSPLGQIYRKNKANSVFYREATFYSVDEVVFHLKSSGFNTFTFNQTLFKPVALLSDIEPVKQGYGEGSFIVIKSQKKEVDNWENTKKL